MNSVSVQIQRAISDAISTQVLPQIQNVMKAGSGHGTRKGWDVPAERPELISEVQRNLNAKNNLRNEQDGNQSDNDFLGLNVHDIVTGDNESPNPVPEFLTGRIPSTTHLNQPYEDINLDTTIPAHERIATAAYPDPITRLADVLTTMQNRPTAQQLTIRPVNSNTMTFDGKSETFELFEDLKQPEQHDRLRRKRVRYHLQLLQGKEPHGQGLRKTEKEKRERCPTRQVDSEENVSGSVALVAKRTTRRKDVGKVLVHILTPNALGPRTQLTISPIQRLRNLRPDRHHQAPNPHILMMNQKTNFATTPI